MRNDREFQFLTLVKWAQFSLLFFASLFFWFPASAEVLTKEEQLQLARTILREASAEIPNLPDGNFPPWGEAMVQTLRVDILKDLAIVQGKIHDQEGLQKSATRAIRITKTYCSNIDLLTDIGNAQVQAGFLEDGVQTVEAALKAVRRQKDTNDSLNSWLHSISETLGQAGKTDRAIEVAYMISDVPEKIKAFEAIRFHEAKAGHKENARDLNGLTQRIFAQLDDSNVIGKTWALIDKASNHLVLNEVEVAENTLTQAKLVIKEIPESDLRIYPLLSIAEEAEKMGREAAYEQTLQEMVNEIPMISNGYKRGQGYWALAEHYLKQGKMEDALPFIQKALDAANEASDGYLRGHILLILAMAEMKAGQMDEAKRVLNKALDVVEESQRLQDKVLVIQEFHWYKEAVKSLPMEIIGRIREIVQNIPAGAEPSKSYALDVLAFLYAQNGWLEKSSETIGQMSFGQPVKGQAIQKLAKIKIQKDGVSATVKWAKNLDVPVEKVRAHIGIAEGIGEKFGLSDP